MLHHIAQRVLRLVAALVLLTAAATGWSQISFVPGTLSGYTGSNPTSLQYGPDGRLYVATQSGAIVALTVARNGAGQYSVEDTETIDLVRLIPNHDDDGTPHPVEKRQITGILVTGTAIQPVLYVTSSDYRIGGNNAAADTNLDTNSGMVSRLVRQGPGVWSKVDLVRGLPRSEENHSPNGLQLDAETNTLYIAQGGNTNAGGISNNFAFLGETALAAAILAVDLDVIDALPVQGQDTAHPWVYDLPTVDDPTRENLPDGSDPGDPFGGNDGLNQARLVPGGPVTVYAPGFRNPYDLLITESGRMYTIDNGGNNAWGGTPIWEDPSDPGTATNNYDPSEPGSGRSNPDVNGEFVTNRDLLHLITGPGYYGGHPNPIRANPAGAGWYTFMDGEGVWRTSTSGDHPLPADWPPVPVEMANPIEGDFQMHDHPHALWEWSNSTNGLAEYTAGNFGGAMKGNLLTVTFGDRVDRIVLNEAGDQVQTVTALATPPQGTIPLDVTAQGDTDIFPGTVWVAAYAANGILVYEPTDYDGDGSGPCVGLNDPNFDSDGDGYSNADELANGTDPCNPADYPADFDGDFVSDLLDDDDDGDGIPDVEDPFQRDPLNGITERVPLRLELLNGDPGYGYAGVGFTGWMIDYETDYLDLYNEDDIIAGGASGIFTVSDIGHGDAYLDKNDQINAFQFGINIDAHTGPFVVRSRLAAATLFQPNPQGYQTAGIYIGNGDQDNYLRISAAANSGVGGIEVYYESGGQQIHQQMHPDPAVLSAQENIDLYLTIDPATGVVTPAYNINGSPIQELDSLTLEDPILSLLRRGPDSEGAHTLAVGIIATSNPRELGTPEGETGFSANWDFIYITHVDAALSHTWTTASTTGSAQARHESGLAAVNGEVLLMGGRGMKPVEHLDIDTLAWSTGAVPPVELHHFQPVVYDGLVYVIGALTGAYPTETPLEQIYIYDPVTMEWHEGPVIPEDRRRGAAGVALLDRRIYIAGGVTLGHGQGEETTVPWLDVYDPVTNTWTELADAPHARDHTQLVEAGGQLYLVGGRVGGTEDGFFGATVAAVDVYDPNTDTWTTLDEDLPTPRGGVMAARLGSRVIIAGGESGQPDAHDEVQAYNFVSEAWETLDSLGQARHGTGMVAAGNALVVIAGSGSRGGSPELNSVEVFSDGSGLVNVFPEIEPGTLEFAPESLEFGTVLAGSSGNQSFHIANTGGNQGIVIEALAVAGDSDFEIDQGYDLPLVLAPEHEIVLDLAFNASGSGNKSGTVTVTYNGGQTATLNATGTSQPTVGAGEIIRINSGGLSDYVDSLGRTWIADAYFVNGYRTTSDAIVSGTDHPTLFQTERYGRHNSQNGPFGYSIPVTAGTYNVVIHTAETYFGVSANPDGDNTGARVFSILIEGERVLSNYDMWATVGPNVAVALSFEDIEVTDGILDITVEAAANNAKFNALEIIPVSTGGPGTPGTLSADPSSLNFDVVQIDAQAERSLVLSNPGDAAVTISGTSFTGSDAEAFALQNTLTGTEVAAGATVTVTVTFSPGSAGSKSAMLNIAHDGSGSPLGVQLSGTAQEAAVATLSVTPGSLNFESVVVGEDATRELTLSNTGTASLTIESASFAGGGTAPFSHDLPAGTDLAPGASVPVIVTFAPTAEGEVTATLEFSHTGANGTVSVNLAGNGTGGSTGPGLEAFPDATWDESSGMWNSSWYGTFRATEESLPWIWHPQHGWQWVHVIEPDESYWLYDMHYGWSYIATHAYPWIFFHQWNEWSYYSGHGVETERWFWNEGQEWFVIGQR